MELYKNDYSPSEDSMLYQLHEIRHTLAEQNQSPEEMNAAGRRIIAAYQLKNLRIVHPMRDRELEKKAA